MKKQDRNKLYMGIFVVFIMISSTIGFMYGSGNTKKYEGHSFTLTEDGWVTYIKNKGYWKFNYLPKELDFESDVGILTRKSYIVIDDDVYFYDISRRFALLGLIVDRIDLEDVNCSLSGIDDKTLIFDEMEYNKIYKENNCVYLKGDKDKLIDRLFYHILGVM